MKKTLKELREELFERRKSAKSILDGADTEQRDVTDQEMIEFRSIQGEITALEEKITREEEIREFRAASYATIGTGVSGEGISEKEKREIGGFSIVRGLQLMAQGKPLDGIELEAHQEAEKSARANGVELEGFGVPAFFGTEKRGQTVSGQTTVAGDQGGVTVPTELNGVIESLWDRSILGPVGATRLAGLHGNQDFIVEETVPEAQELTEVEEMDEDEITWSKFGMSPKRRGSSIPYSKQLLLQSSIDVQRYILKNLGLALEHKLNAESVAALLAAITTPNGNLLSIDANGGAPTYDHIVQLEGLVDGVNANIGSMRYLTNTKVKSKLKRTQVFEGTNGEPVWGKGNMVNDYPGVVSNIVPSNIVKNTSGPVCSAIIYGDFRYLYAGFWGGADFVIDGVTRAKKSEILITCNMFWDTKVARAKSFSGIKDAITT